MARVFIVSALFVAAACAQTPVTFEVASIKLHVAQGDAGSESSSTNVLPGGRLSSSNVTVRKLIRNAFGTEDWAIIGAPGWIDSASYDIDAKTAGGIAITRENIQQLIESLLVTRFGFQYHREMRDAPEFALETMKGGIKLKVSTADGEPSMSTNLSASTVTLHATKLSMKDFGALLTRQTGRPVVDHTGIAGLFDVDLTWSRDLAVDSGVPSIYAALQTLGLRLNSIKGQAETIAIDRVERPSEN